MIAIAFTQAAADGNNIPSLTEIDLPIPTAHGRDLLVAVKAISVNPVDTKVRAGFQGDTPRVLGWDAVGVVQSVGEEVTLFAPGDEVWYAGALGRAGDIAGEVAGQPMRCTIDGVLRGILADGTPVFRGMKAGDVDPRCKPEYCTTASDKALAVGGGVLEAVLHLHHQHPKTGK